MCGIVAVFAYGKCAEPVSDREILDIRDSMVRRGPDAAGYWKSEDQRVGLGHRRLAIIDLTPGGNQPMTLNAAGLSITFNGEIYNYRELRRELEERGHSFRSQSDTEVILRAYMEFGRDFVRRLRGMFAFALWDGDRGGLLLGRDPYGIKPLYYADQNGRITIASQVKALLAGGRIRRTLSAAGQVSFLLWGFITEPHTLYNDIKALPAGSTLWVDRQGQHALQKFWSMSEIFRTAAQEPARRDGARQEAALQRLRESLSETVRYHMVSDVPVGIFLSAGLDSSSIASLASEEPRSELRTLTLGIDQLRNTAADEVPLAEQVAAALGAQHQTSWIGSAHFAQEHDQLMAAMDQPSIDGVNVYLISQMAAKAGLKVALSGLGGDELFGGYPSFKQIPRFLNALNPLSRVPVIGKGFRILSAPIMRHFTSPKYAGLLEYGKSVEGAYLLRRGLFMPWELPDILDPETVKAGWGELEPLIRLPENLSGLDDRTQIAILESTLYMRNQLLRDGDWAGMAHSIEIRFPLVDATLFQQLAPLLTGPAPLGKIDMASILTRPLPPSVLTRPKTGFMVPVRDWLTETRPSKVSSTERGLRSWAKYVLREQLANVPLSRTPAN